MAVSRRALFGKLDLTLFRAIESATAFAKLRGNPQRRADALAAPALATQRQRPALRRRRSLSCCILLPPKWTPELKATVRWTIGDWTVQYEQIENLSTKEQIRCCWAERTLTKAVPVEPYGEDGGRLQVFFLPNDEIKVHVSNYDLGHEKHPSGLAYPENPNPLPEATQR